MSDKSIRQESVKRFSVYWIEIEYISIVFLSAAFAVFMGMYISASLIIEDFPELSYPLAIDKIPSEMIFFGIVSIFVFFVAGTPMYYGMKWCYYQAAMGKAVPVSCLFSCYTSAARWINSLKLKLITDLNKLLVGGPMICLAAAEYYLGKKLAEHYEGSMIGMLFGGLFILMVFSMLLVYLLYSVKFSAVPYIFISDPDRPVTETYRTGISVTADHKFRLFKLKCRFIPLFVICLAGFPIFLVYPYYTMTIAVACEKIINGNMLENDISVEHKVLTEDTYKETADAGRI